MKSEGIPQAIHLKDYRQPSFWISTVHLRFDLNEDQTRVRSKLEMKRNSSRSGSGSSLILDGDNLALRRVIIDGRELSSSEFSRNETELRIAAVPDRFTLEIETELEPQKNLSCEGLYKSGGMFSTQCEAESFRKITYFLDRPDVMAVYTVTIEADKEKYPVLLSNGNLVSRKDLGNGRHQAVWHDPYRKPSYLFALVAGDLGMIEDRHVTRSGREVKLRIFARKGLQDRCSHAMDSLKRSMKWDEDTYGLEYDLDVYMIVVAENFNMGAMENKGLNIFNATYVLAKPETATDSDYDSIMSVVAHEYLHNWTGNRVTCRDWFQLSLKEGLTVFRDQKFSADMRSESVQRLEQVIRIRTHQFAEDSGPMAHPVRPQSYISIDNFYTLTVYEKGAEVIRMIETIVGRDGFRRGMDLYFKRHDGQAVTTDDFVAAMADANGVDLTQFKNWYDQAGTPVITVSAQHNANKELYTLTIEQSCPPSPGQSEKKPYHIPIAVGLLAGDGRDLPLQLVNGNRLSSGTKEHTLVLHLREPKQSFTFTGVKEKPVLSLLRGFSAPVRCEFAYTDDELAFLMAHDSDAFARWEAAQKLTVRTAMELVEDFQEKRPLREPSRLVEAFGRVLSNAKLDPAYISFLLSLPAEQYIAQFYKTVDIDAVHAAREHILRAISRAHHPAFRSLFDRLSQMPTGEIKMDPKAAGLRSLKNRALEYLTMSESSIDLELAVKQRREAMNMTDELGALQALNRTTSPVRQQAFGEFYDKWKQEPLVMNKWLSMQALTPLPNALEIVMKLTEDPVFDINNPNKVYSLFVAFSRFNLVRFHDRSGAAYKYMADLVMDIDTRNPQVASRLIGAFSQWRNLDEGRQQLMKAQLERIMAKPGLSNNVFEIASKSLE